METATTGRGETGSRGRATSPGEKGAVRRTGPSRAVTLIYLLAVYAALQAYLWLGVPSHRITLVIGGALVILAIVFGDPWRRGETPRSLGLAGRDLVGALKVLVVPVAALVIVLVAIKLFIPGHGGPGGVARRLALILPWAFLQQYLLQATFNRRLTAAFGPGLATSILNGILFAGMHLPGGLLVGLTFAAGTWWSRLYQRRSNLWLVILLHVLLSAAAQTFVPMAWTHGFRVGPGYYHWHGEVG